MDEKAYKRLVRFAIAASAIVVILMFIVVLLLSYQLAQLRSTVAVVNEKVSNLPELPKVINGEDGITTTIVQYTPGQDGKDATDEQVARAVENYFVSHPVKNGEDGVSIQGERGEPGIDGKVVFIRQLLTGEFQCRYAGDLEWQSIEECQ